MRARQKKRGQERRPSSILILPFCHRMRLALGFKRIDYAKATARFYAPAHFRAISAYDRQPVLVTGDGA